MAALVALLAPLPDIGEDFGRRRDAGIGRFVRRIAPGMRTRGCAAGKIDWIFGVRGYAMDFIESRH